jgi:putative tricarboxylic transport membrane protein
MNQVNRISGFSVLFGAGALMSEALKLEFTTDIGPGPGFFPVWLCAIMAVLALLLIAKTFTRAEVQTAIDNPGGAVLRKVGTVFAALIGFVIVTPIVGFIGGASLFLITIFSFIESMKLRQALPLAAAIACAFYLIFSVGLGVKLPTGFMGI